MTDTKARNRMKDIVEWKLQHDVDHTREQIIQRARSLAERLNRVANDLEADPDASFNTLGVLQGNGGELDTWCVKLGYARETLKMFRQAIAADEKTEEE